jgi:hypothetical protein
VIHPQEFHETWFLRPGCEEERGSAWVEAGLDDREAVEMTARWYHDYFCGGISGPSRSIADITAYMDRMSYG